MFVVTALPLVAASFSTGLALTALPRCVSRRCTALVAASFSTGLALTALPRCVSGRCVIRHQTVFDSIVPYRLIQGWAEQSPSAISEPTQPHRSKAFGQWTASVALRRNRLQASRRAQIESEPRQGFIPCIVRTSVSCAANTSLPCRSSRLGTKVLKRRPAAEPSGTTILIRSYFAPFIC